jgi:hypothetical protein
MDTISITHPAPPPTRELRGLALHRDHGAEIEHTGHGVYTVPGGGGGTYRVDLAVFGGEESCSCPDYQRHKQPCEHIYATSLYRAKARAAARRAQAERTAARASAANLAPLAAL